MIAPSLVHRAQQGKHADPAWYRVHRRLSIRLSVPLARGAVPPDAVTGAQMVVWLAGAALVAAAPLAANLAGFVLLYASFVLDKVDGEVARLRGLSHARGVLLDRFHHRIVEPTLFLAAGWHAFARTGATRDLVAGFALALLANVIEEHQQLAPWIFLKRIREDGAPRPGGRSAPAAWRRARALMRPLKVFRTPITAMALVFACTIGERLAGRPLVGDCLVVGVAALAAYVVFQCVDYYAYRLDEEMRDIARVHETAARTAPATARGPAGRAAAGGVDALNTGFAASLGTEVRTWRNE